jgi:hypothetical protein
MMRGVAVLTFLFLVAGRAGSEDREPLKFDRVFALRSGEIFVGFEDPHGLRSAEPIVLMSDTIVRAFADTTDCTYFGYELTVKPTTDAVEMSLGPLRGPADTKVRRGLPCSNPRPLASSPPTFPAATVVPLAQTIDVDVLTDPRTGSRVTDKVRFLRKVRPWEKEEKTLSFSGNVVVHEGADRPQLRMEDVVLRISGPSVLRVDTKTYEDGPGCAGEVVVLQTPGGDRFALSLAPRGTLPFVEAGVVSGDTLSFRWNGVWHHWTGHNPILGPRARCPLWVMKVETGSLTFERGVVGCMATSGAHLGALR